MDNNKILISSFETDLSGENWEDKLISRFKSLRNKKYKRVSISLYSSENEIILNSGIDPVIYKKIKNVQNLPAYVINDLFGVKGIIKRKSFGRDILV